VIKDSEGQVLVSATSKMNGHEDPMLAEAWALYRSMELARDCCHFMLFLKVIVKGLSSLLKGIRNMNRHFVGSEFAWVW